MQNMKALGENYKSFSRDLASLGLCGLRILAPRMLLRKVRERQMLTTSQCFAISKNECTFYVGDPALSGKLNNLSK